MVLAIVMAIYATLGFTPAISGVLRENGLLELAFAAGAGLVALVVVIHGLKSNGAGVVFLLSVLAVYLLVLVRIESPEERTHIVEYGVLAILLFEAFAERAKNDRYALTPSFSAIILASAIGVADELIQAWLPNRVFDLRDIAFNILASALAVLSSMTLAWMRDRRGRA